MTFVSTTGCDEDPSGVLTCTLGTITNSAKVSSSTADPNSSNNTASEDTTVIGAQPPQPRETKQNVLENLREHEGESKRIKKAIKELSKSLEDKLWEDDSHLDPKHGKKVFDREKHAVKELMKVVKDDSKGKDKVSDDALAASQAAIDDLLSADRILAEIAINEAGPALDPKRQDKVDKELDKSGKEMVKAAEELAKGKPDKAIDHYKKAWKHAIHALKEALKAPKGG